MLLYRRNMVFLYSKVRNYFILVTVLNDQSNIYLQVSAMCEENITIWFYLEVFTLVW